MGQPRGERIKITGRKRELEPRLKIPDFVLSKKAHAAIDDLMKAVPTQQGVRLKRDWFPERPVDKNEDTITQNAYRNIYAILRDQDASRDIVTALAKAVGALEYGPRSYVASDPIGLFREKEIANIPKEKIVGGELKKGTYLLCAVVNGELAFPGGFTDSMMTANGTLAKELSEEVMADCKNPEDYFSVKMGFEDSDPGRSGVRSEPFGLHVMSYMGLMVPKQGKKFTFKGGDDSSDYRFVRIFDETGEIDLDSMNILPWREDHKALVRRMANWWESYKTKRVKHDPEFASKDMRSFLETLPNEPIIKTPFDPTPESKRGKTPFNVQLAEQVVKTVLEAHGIPHVISPQIIAAIHGRKDEKGKSLRSENYIPDFDGPIASVDQIIVGHGEHENDILLEEYTDKDSGELRYRVPGMLSRYNKNMRQVATEGSNTKYSIHSTPLLFAGTVQERLEDGATLRDNRQPTIGFVYVSEFSNDPGKEKSKRLKWVRLLNETKTDVHDDIKKMRFDFHQNEIIRKAVETMINLRIVANDKLSLLKSLQSRAVIF